MLWRTTALVGVAVLALVGAAPQARAVTTPITMCGQTVGTNAVLVTDLECTGHGIVVVAPGITVDLKGHTLVGDRGANDAGVFDAGHDRITIKNGVIRNFGYGINADLDASQISIVNVVSSGNFSPGISIVGGSASIKSTV